MGQRGKASRILSLFQGGLFTYAAPKSAAITAPGQFTCAELRKTYLLESPVLSDKLFAVVADFSANNLAMAYNSSHRTEGALYLPFVFREQDRDDFLHFAIRIPLHRFFIYGELQRSFAQKISRQDKEALQNGKVDTVVNTGKTLNGLHLQIDTSTTLTHNRNPMATSSGI